ncbi:hypothetical protein NUW58_g4838 [Xylaria curta]|uniref:Uncharacterized protein n=1 Tax=Xylaria curta TaxID=42375 RepID=A0ACC1P6A2_9PEZI|nr:hypothetical protein NUW58_g4838 [Xylaria curta]
MPPPHEKGSKTVPKFASFKPKGPGVIRHAPEAATVKSERAEGDCIAQTSNPQARRHLPVDNDAAPKPFSRDLHRPTDRELGGNAYYYLDKRGDALIIRYGSNDRSRIPQYRRIGAGRVLGADGIMRIERLGTREEFFIRGHHESGSLLSSDRKTLLARGVRPDSQPIRVRRRRSEGGAATEDYISFKSSRKRKRDENVSEASSGDEGPSYRSIHGKSRSHEHSDSDEEYDSDPSEDVVNRSISDPTATRFIELSRKVREHPEDTDSWLELVDHQNTLLASQSGARAPTAAEIRSFADIKLSLLEQALSHASDDRLRERLNIKVIEEGLKVWEFKAALKRSVETMRIYPKSFEIWKLYISFLQTTISACRYDEIKQLYIDKLQSLQKELLNSSTPQEQTEYSEQILFVFLRLTRFLADSGFAELASAAWQASLELNLVRPPIPTQTGNEIPSSFREYWESEVPRLGEDSWRGWAAFATDTDAQEPPDPKASNPSISLTTRDGYKVWYTVEHHRSQCALIPARTLDEGAEDDPFRVVMFADFQDILLYFPAELIPRLRQQLLDAFLIFCHLPPSPQCGNLAGLVMKDPLLVRSVPSVPFTHLLPRNKIDSSDDQQTKPPELFCEIQRMVPTPDVLFPSTQWFRYLDPAHDKLPHNGYLWVMTTLKQLTRIAGTSELGPYALAFESINESGNEKKSAKALLKQDPFNVDLYLGYSTIEREQQNKAAARNVLSAALGLPSIVPHDRVRLHIGAAWLELDDGNLGKAILQLCQIVEPESKSGNAQIAEPIEATPSRILRAKQFLVTNRDYKFSSGGTAEAVIYAEGLVLLDYLTQRSEKETSSRKQGDIQFAIVRINQCSQDLVSRGQKHSSSHETFLQFSARLLYYHASHG